MKKSLIFLAIAWAVCGAFWFYTRTSQDGPVLRPISGSGEPDLSTVSTTPKESTRDSNAPAMETDRVETSDTVRKDLLREYWQLLLGDQRNDWCPSKRVDMFKEFAHILAMDFDEAREHLDALTSLDDDFGGDRQSFTGALITQMALKNPVEAVVYMVESDFGFDSEEYENVVRLWMDTEGASIMDWFDQSDIRNVKGSLARAFERVYVEEDPYDYLLRYGSAKNSYFNREATDYLYEENGAGVYEALKAANLAPEVLADSFKSIGESLFEEDPGGARDWIQINRYSVGELVTKQLTFELLERGYYSDPRLATDTLEWALQQKMVSEADDSVKYLVRNMGRRNAEPVRQMLQRIQEQSGIPTAELIEVLPKSEKDDQAIFDLKPFEWDESDNVTFYCGVSVEVEPKSDPEKVALLVAGLRGNNW